MIDTVKPGGTFRPCCSPAVAREKANPSTIKLNRLHALRIDRASDLKTFLNAPAYWVKMALFVLLLANGAWLQRTERRPDSTEPGPWTKLRWAAGFSLALWFAILFTSILVTTAA